MRSLGLIGLGFWVALAGVSAEELKFEGSQYRLGQRLVVGSNATLGLTGPAEGWLLDGQPLNPQISTWEEGLHRLSESGSTEAETSPAMEVIVDRSAPKIGWKNGELDTLVENHGADYDISGKGDADLERAKDAPKQIEWSSDGKVWSPVTWGLPDGSPATDPQGGEVLASWLVRSHRPQVFFRKARRGGGDALFGEGAPVPLEKKNEVLLVSAEDRWSAVASLRFSVVRWGELNRLVIESADVVGNGTRLEWPLAD